MMNLAIQQRRFPSRVLKVQSGVFVDVSLTNGVNSCEIYRKPLRSLRILYYQKQCQLGLKKMVES